MTDAERDVLLAHPASAQRALAFTRHSRGFVALAAKPCPYLDGSSCSVYEARPYNCRRTLCGREDPRREPLTLSTRGPIGFQSADDRFHASRAFRRLVIRMTERAQKWALAHGWRP